MAKKQNKNLLEFYTDTLESLGLIVAEDGYIYIGGKSKTLMEADKKLLVLPTREHINSLLDTTESGEIVVTKIPYNPLNEDTLKGDSISLKKTKLLVERRLGHGIAIAGQLLLTVASNNDLQKGLDFSITAFLKSIHKAKNANIKALVDEQSFTSWQSIYSQALKQEVGIISIFLKKNGVYEATKFNRLAVTNSPVYDQLCLANKDNSVVYNAKLRQKDITIFKLIYEFLLDDLDENGTINVGSLDRESPAFIALMRTYIKVADKINRVLTALRDLDQSKADDAIMNIKIADDELDSLAKYHVELSAIPNETDLTRSVSKQSTAAPAGDTPPWESGLAGTMTTPPAMNRPAPILPDQYNIAPVPQAVSPLHGQPVMPAQQPAPAPIDPVLALAYAGNQPQMHMGMYPQPPMMGMGFPLFMQ